LFRLGTRGSFGGHGAPVDRRSRPPFALTPTSCRQPGGPPFGGVGIRRQTCASAELAGLVVFHRDKDFDLIAMVTGQPVERMTVEGYAQQVAGNRVGMLTILLIVLLVVLLAGGIGGPRYYRGRRSTVVREREIL